jgi:SAM-dependent methyltransferase
MSTEIKLNIGAGDSNIPGFIPIDAKLGHDALKLPYETGTVDEVYASHVLEHIHHSKTLDAVNEWVRVLKPGGRIRIAVPDFHKVFRQYKDGEMSDDMLAAWLHGSHDVATDRHQAVLNHENLTAMLRRCAVDDIAIFKPEYDDCSKLPMSLNMEGFKRQIVVPKDPKVAMVLSVPRIGFMDMVDGIADTCRKLGWPFYKWGGTEWGKGLTQAVQNAIRDFDPDYIMCLDYDSVFTAEDCRELLRLMQRNPDVGAIYPAEAHRHGDLPLGYDMNGTIDYRGELTQVPSGHFGCTIIRRKIFDDIPHPWFFSCPDPKTGLWNQNNIDADITFWALMGIHGWHTCQANNVQIGHMELCVKWMKPDGIIWQPIQHYRKHGKPPNAQFDGPYWTSRTIPAIQARAAAEEAAKKAEQDKSTTVADLLVPPTNIEGVSNGTDGIKHGVNGHARVSV